MTDIYDLEPSDTWKACDGFDAHANLIETIKNPGKPTADELKASSDALVRIKGADLGFSITRPERTTAQLVDRIDALNNLVVVARLLCDNVETVGTHHRIDGKYLEDLRKALDGL